MVEEEDEEEEILDSSQMIIVDIDFGERNFEIEDNRTRSNIIISTFPHIKDQKRVIVKVQCLLA